LKCRSAVIKLGGSLITDKSSPRTVKWDSLNDSALQIYKYYKENNAKIAIIHGGGSFGHYEVEKIRKSKNVIDPFSTSLIQESMLTLALAVLKALIGVGIPASLHPTHTICKSNANDCNYFSIINDLNNGLVPITYGDAVFDGEGKIISGDDLSVQISNLINSDCLIFATDVDGVLDEKGNLIREIKRNHYINVINKDVFDVTGGIVNKINKAFNSKSNNIRIVSGKKIYNALNGEDVGTKIINL
jgi:Predicted archaeal kinase